MKIMDLLNKIANGEEVPKKIYCFNREFYLKGNTYFGDTFTLMHYIQEDLNDEVEIIEEEKKIPEKLTTWFTLEKDCENDNIQYANYNFKTMYEKINEICDYFKSKGE